VKEEGRKTVGGENSAELQNGHLVTMARRIIDLSVKTKKENTAGVPFKKERRRLGKIMGKFSFWK